MKKLMLVVLFAFLIIPTLTNAGIIYKQDSWCISDQVEVVAIRLDREDNYVRILFKGIPEIVQFQFDNFHEAKEAYGLIVNRVKWAR